MLLHTSGDLGASAAPQHVKLCACALVAWWEEGGAVRAAGGPSAPIKANQVSLAAVFSGGRYLPLFVVSSRDDVGRCHLVLVLTLRTAM